MRTIALNGKNETTYPVGMSTVVRGGDPDVTIAEPGAYPVVFRTEASGYILMSTVDQVIAHMRRRPEATLYGQPEIIRAICLQVEDPITMEEIHQAVVRYVDHLNRL